MAELAKYGVSKTFYFPLIDINATDGSYLTGAVAVSGDIELSKDGATFGNASALFAEVGRGWYSVTLTINELQAKKVLVSIIDQGTKLFVDQAFHISTYGDAAADLVFDLGVATQNVAVASMANNVMTAAAAATDLTAELQNGLATATNLATLQATADATLGHVDTEIDAIASNVVAVGNAVGAVGVVVDNIYGKVDTEVAAIKAKTDLIPASPASTTDVPSASTIAQTILLFDWTTIITTVPARCMLNALRFLRNKWTTTAGTISIKKEDDATEAWNGTITETTGADPVTGFTPST